MSLTVNTTSIIDALTHVRKFSGEVALIKLGGSILHDKKLIQLLCQDLSLLKASGMKIVIVHGGSKAIGTALKQYNIKTEFLNGLRVTTSAAMDTIEMVLCGKVNRMLVRRLNALGVNTIGLSGTDNKLLLCNHYGEGYGCVGTIKNVNRSMIQEFVKTQDLNAGFIPVISPVGVDDQGQALNVNADSAASAIAVALGVEKMVYLTDQDGIKGKDGVVISTLNALELEKLVDLGVVRDGMLAKVKSVLNALNQGIRDIHIINGGTPHALLTELFTTEGIGTVCKKVERKNGEE